MNLRDIWETLPSDPDLWGVTEWLEKERYVLVTESRYHTQETRESHALNGNMFGLVVNAETGIPIICGHGGSMWLCPGCAEKILQDGLWGST